MTAAKARILIFSSSYVPVIGGVQTVAHNLAKQLIANGHEVRVVTNRYPVALPARERIDGVEVDRLLLLRPEVDQLRRSRPDLFVASLYFGPESYWRLKNIFRQFRPDIVNVHFPDHQIASVLKLRRQFDFRLVVSLHGHDVERMTNGTELKKGAHANALRNFRAILRAADTVTAVSRDLLNKAIQVEPAISDKGHVIHNGIDPKRFAQDCSYHHGRPYILALGRLVYKKGFDLLIDAFARCDSRGKPDLIIAGAGEERRALDERVQTLGLEGKVHFFGEASSDEVVKLLNGCWGVVVPSRTEPFGLVALEALAAGKPVVATKTGGLEEFLLPIVFDEQASGLNGKRRVTLVAPSVEGITHGLETLLASRGNGEERNYLLPEKFTWPYVARMYEQVLLGNRNQEV